MAKKNKKNRPVEVRINIDGLQIVATPGNHSADLDHLLERQGAESFVFIPLAKLDKQRKNKRRKSARKRAKLPLGNWYDGELLRRDDGAVVRGVLAFDIRRRNAREIARNLGVKQFIWGTSASPVEQHAVQIFEDNDSNDWKSVRRRAFAGLSDMAIAARNIEALPTAVQESQTTMRRFWQLVAVVLLVAISAGAVKALAASLTGSDGSESNSWSMISVLFYPFVTPAILVGIYLRVLVRKGEEDARDFTAAEAEENWVKVAPHLLALWALCWSAILLLTWVQSIPGSDLPFFGRVGGVTTWLIICVWMLLPIANSHNVETLFKSAIEAGVAAAVSIFTITLSLALANLLTDTVWNVVTSIVPFEIPAWIQQAINFFVNFGAEVFFVAVMLGYAWAKTRQQFMRL